MARRNIFSRLADTIPGARIANSATRALRSIGRGGNNEEVLDPTLPESAQNFATQQSQQNRINSTSTFIGIARSMLFGASLPVLIVFLFVAISCIGAFLSLASLAGYSHGSNANAKTVITQLEERNCTPGQGCDADQIKRIICEENKREIVDKETGNTIQNYSSEECQRILEAEETLSNSTSSAAGN